MKEYRSKRDLPHTSKSKYHEWIKIYQGESKSENEIRSIVMNQNLKMKQDLNFKIDSKSEKTKGLLHLHFLPPGRRPPPLPLVQQRAAVVPPEKERVRE